MLRNLEGGFHEIGFLLLAVVTLTGIVAYTAPASGNANEEAAPIFGIKIPPGYRDFRSAIFVPRLHSPESKIRFAEGERPPLTYSAQKRSTSITAWAKACGSSCGRLWPNAARDGAVLILTRKLLRVGTRLRVRRTVRIAFQRDRGYRDGGELGEPLFHIVILWLAFSQSDPPAIVVDHDGNVVGIVERRCTAIECGIVEAPLR